MNQEGPNPINYANPIAAPGVEVLSDGTDGTFHCRISPSKISYSQKQIFICLGAFHLGILLLAIAFIKFHTIGSILSHPPGVVLGLSGVAGVGYGLFIILYYAVFPQPVTFEYLADGHQLIVGYDGKMLSPIPADQIQDLWIKPSGHAIENYLWNLNLITRDNRFITYHFNSPLTAELSAHEPLLRKILGVTEVCNRSIIQGFGRRFHEIREGNTHEHPKLGPHDSPPTPPGSSTPTIGMEILSDGSDGTFHCVIVNSLKSKKYKSVEFIANAEQLTIIANGACRETFPRSQFREIAFHRKIFPLIFGRLWLLRIRWNDGIVFEFRFKIPPKVNFKKNAETMGKLLQIPDGSAIGLLARPDYRLTPRMGVFERERIYQN